MTVAPDRYKCNWIQQTVDSMVARISQPQADWTIQRTAQHRLCLERITSLLPNGVLDNSPIGYVPSQATMDNLLADFDSLVFRKSISKYCDFRWQANLSLNGEGCTGFCIPAHSSPTRRVMIVLDSTSRTNWNYIFGTLLHEMCHAFLMLYACVQNCGRGSDCKHMQRLGATGHGKVWQELAHAVEVFVKKEFTVTQGLLDLSRKISAVREYRVSNPSMSDPCLLQSFPDPAIQAQIRLFTLS